LKSLKDKLTTLEAALAQGPSPQRQRLSDTRDAVTHKFNVGGHEGYITVGLYDDGRPGELFIQMAKEGSTMGGLMDTVGTLTSIALQYGVPLETLAEKFSNQRFEPSGFTSNKGIPRATSIIDYVFRWMKQEFPKRKARDVVPATPTPDEPNKVKSNYRDGVCCSTCGSSNVQVTGTCATCRDCGTSLGCS
jgi:ribonucleoside-diphosphate reductase alpha chain